MVDTSNVSGHRSRLERLLKKKPGIEGLEDYVGGGDRFSIGHREKEAIAKHATLDGAVVVDIGCGIGRLTRALVGEPIAEYHGTDILDEPLVEARIVAGSDTRFSFSRIDGLEIPMRDSSVDIACAFSVMTHLLDEEVFMYFKETARTLKQGGIAVFSFKDFSLECHQEEFLTFISHYSQRADVLKWFEKSTLRFFAEANAMSVIEFQDAYVASPAKYPGESFPDGRLSSNRLVMGQSLGFFRKD